MASAASRIRADTRGPGRRFSDLFRNEVAPHVERLEAERRRQRHSCLAVIFATGGVAIGSLIVLWPVNREIAFVLAFALGVWASRCKATYAISSAASCASWSCRRSAGRSAA
jgi:hypothetical protein